MRLALTDEQALVQSSALAWLADAYGFRQRAAGVHRDGGSPAVWRAFAQMGWLGLALPEATGGLALGPLEAGLLMQAFGRHLVVEPWHASVLQPGRLLALAAGAHQQAQWLPGLGSGRLRLALAHTEPADRLPWSRRNTTARRTATGWYLHGAKRQALAAPGAARWIVSAAVDGTTQLFLVDPAADGLQVDAYDTSAGGRAADILFDGTPGEWLGDECSGNAQSGDKRLGDATARLHRVLAEGVVATAWEAVGAMQAALGQTVAYTRQRRQFGQSLSEFQVVQHRLAEMTVHCAEAQAVCELASMQCVLSQAGSIDAAALVQNKVGRAARYVAQEAVQLHGAMGVCEELPIAATFRLLLAFGQQHGSAASHALQRGQALLANGEFAHSQTLCQPAAAALEPTA